MQLYFVKAVLANGDCVFGGHWLADSAADARTIGAAAYEAGFAVSEKYGLPAPAARALVTFEAKRSKADPAAMAMNYVK